MKVKKIDPKRIRLKLTIAIIQWVRMRNPRGCAREKPQYIYTASHRSVEHRSKDTLWRGQLKGNFPQVTIKRAKYLAFQIAIWRTSSTATVTFKKVWARDANVDQQRWARQPVHYESNQPMTTPATQGIFEAPWCKH